MEMVQSFEMTLGHRYQYSEMYILCIPTVTHISTAVSEIYAKNRGVGRSGSESASPPPGPAQVDVAF